MFFIGLLQSIIIITRKRLDKAAKMTTCKQVIRIWWMECKQQGNDTVIRGVMLSVWCDHLLLLTLPYVRLKIINP
jgi:hypothetical protein